MYFCISPLGMKLHLSPVGKPAPPRPRSVPAGLARVEVCAASGDLPNAWCPQTLPTWYIPGVSPIRVSTLHRPLMIDTRTGQRACPPFDPAHTREEIFEFWPDDIAALFRAAGLPRRTPPTAECDRLASQIGNPPRIRSPLTQVSYTLRLSQAQESIALTAHGDADAKRLYWFADSRLLGDTANGAPLEWRPPRSGLYQLTVSDDQGRSATRSLQVEFLP